LARREPVRTRRAHASGGVPGLLKARELSDGKCARERIAERTAKINVEGEPEAHLASVSTMSDV